MMTEARDGICRRHSGELLLQRWFGQRGSCHVCCCRHVDISCRMLRHARGLLAFSTVLISLLIALWRGPALAGRITRYTPSVCLYVCLSVCPAPTVSSKTENRTTFKLRGEVIQVTSNWQSNFKIKSSKVKVTGGGKSEGRISRIGSTLTCYSYKSHACFAAHYSGRRTVIIITELTYCWYYCCHLANKVIYRSGQSAVAVPAESFVVSFSHVSENYTFLSEIK